ncbi:MAG: SgcJ/EcaC family oxidoreductase [Gammaproteobacteria bacterium]
MDHAVADRIYADFARCFNAGDVEGLLDLYEPDAVFVTGPGEHVSGREAIREALQGFLDTGGRIAFKTRHAVQQGDIALLSNEYTLEGTDADGKPFTLTGKTSEVLRRQPDGRWLYIIDHPTGAQD